jgi:hypothetical protein
MYQHYRTKTVSVEDLDRLLEQADVEAARLGGLAGLIVADQVDRADDAELDTYVMDLLDRLCEPDDEDPHRYSRIDGYDVLRAVDERGLMLGTIYECPGRSEKVIELDGEAHSDAQAWATVSAFPAWVRERYRKLILADTAVGAPQLDRNASA